MPKVFVYGTLLNGEYNNRRFLQNAESKLLGEDRIMGFSLHNLGSYPAIRPTDNINKEVLGEVWEISDVVLWDLDRLEGYPHYYNRILVGTSFGEAWAYFIENGHYYPEILSGSWKQFLSERNIE